MDDGRSDLHASRGAAKILEISESKLRYWAQVGFVGPSGRRGGKPVFIFQDLVSVKAAKELVDRGFKAAEIRKAIDGVRASLPHVDRPLDRIRVAFDGDAPGRRRRGQRVRAERPAGLRLRPRRAGRQLGSRRAGEHDGAAAAAGAAREPADAEGSPRARRRRSRRRAARTTGSSRGRAPRRRAATTRAPRPATGEALALDPGLAAARTNLGSLAYRAATRAAREAFEAALALDPDQPEARFNLANLVLERRAIWSWPSPSSAACCRSPRTSPTRTSTWPSRWNASAAAPRRAPTSNATSRSNRRRPRPGPSRPAR